MDQADNFINAENTFQALIESRRKELEQAKRKMKAPTKGKARKKLEKEPRDNKREEAPTRGLGFRSN